MTDITVTPGVNTGMPGKWLERIGPRRLVLLSVSVFLVLLGYELMRWPLQPLDTDTWYHLSGGRYLFKNGRIPSTSFFSFIDPPKTWTNYYWLFQALVYSVYELSGNIGLIALRTLIYLGTVFMIFRFFTHREARVNLGLAMALAAIFSYSLIYRDLLLRPHSFSYLFIVVFVYVLERDRSKIWILPFVGVAWSNLHGIEFFIMYCIAGAYLAELIYNRLRKIKDGFQLTKAQRFWLVAIFYAALCSPHHIRLIMEPFQGLSHYTQYYIMEMAQPSLSAYFQISLLPPVRLFNDFRALASLLVILAFLVLVLKREIRVSHLIIFACSLFLFTKYIRFQFEFQLMNLPMVCAAARRICSRDIKDSLNAWLAGFMAFVMVSPIALQFTTFQSRPQYPFDEKHVPVGVCAFLNEIDKGGSILNVAGRGGYLNWALKDNYKIYMDLELSMFDDKDFFLGELARFDKELLRHFLERYDPSFASVQKDNSVFKENIAEYEKYVPVFFDDVEVLYVNKEHYPEIADKYALKYDAMDIDGMDLAEISDEELAELDGEMDRLLSVFPRIAMARWVKCNIEMLREAPEKALEHAAIFVESRPDQPTGYELRAKALAKLGRHEEAVADLRKALGRTQKAYWAKDQRLIFESQLAMAEAESGPGAGDYKSALKTLRKFVNPFNSKVHYMDVYELGRLNMIAGSLRDAEMYLTLAQYLLPEELPEEAKGVDEKIKEFLAILRQE